MAERRFRQQLLRKGDAAKIRDEVAQEMRENIILVGFQFHFDLVGGWQQLP